MAPDVTFMTGLAICFVPVFGGTTGCTVVAPIYAMMSSDVTVEVYSMSGSIGIEKGWFVIVTGTIVLNRNSDAIVEGDVVVEWLVMT